MLGSVGGCREGQRDRDADEVDVGDVGEETTIEGEFGKSPIEVVVGITGIGDRRLYELLKRLVKSLK